MVTILHARQQKRHRCKEQTFGLCRRRQGWHDLRDNIETCISLYAKQITSVSLMHEAGHSKPVPWDNPEGWGRKGCGRGIQHGETHGHPWVIHVNVWQKPTQYCK